MLLISKVVDTPERNLPIFDVNVKVGLRCLLLHDGSLSIAAEITIDSLIPFVNDRELKVSANISATC